MLSSLIKSLLEFIMQVLHVNKERVDVERVRERQAEIERTDYGDSRTIANELRNRARTRN
jgi:hypothetical protein